MRNKLCLGTAQLGMKYGIKNEIGRQPSQDESKIILKKAIESGIEYFDTASVYGEAENVLGNFGIKDYPVKVITKLKPGVISEQDVLTEIRKSLYKIDIDILDGYMLHDAKDFYNVNILKGLYRVKELGLVKNIGVSVYMPEDALAVARNANIDYIQIPYNVFDQRLDQTDFFELTEKNNIIVFARSAFLQGLLLMDIGQLPAKLSIAKPYLKKFNEIVNRYGYSRQEGAFLFTYLHKGIDKIVFGVDTVEQLMDNFEIVSSSIGFDCCYKELYQHFTDIKKEIISPNLWN